MQPIRIVYYSEVIDNFGRLEASMKGPIIFSVLMNSPEWTDDMVFEDEGGRKYSIDELIGKQVSVPDIGVFEVPKCDSCGSEPGSMHTCPFAEEINGDSETLCNCCSECECRCAMDI